MAEPIVVRFTIDDVEYSFTWRMTVKEAMFIQEKAHVAPRDLWPALDRQDPSAVAAFMWTVRKRDGEAISWAEVLKHDVLSFRFLPPEETEEAEESEEGSDSADPISKPGKTRKAATKSTG